MDLGESQRHSELLVNLRSKISGCSGAIDLRGALSQVNGHHSATRSEHVSLLSENARLASNNNKLIAYIKEFETRQSGLFSRVSFLEEERRAMEAYIGRVNKENKILKVTIQDRDTEILRLQSLLPQIQEWKTKFEVSQAEVSRLNFTVTGLKEDINALTINYEGQIRDLRAQIRQLSGNVASL